MSVATHKPEVVILTWPGAEFPHAKTFLSGCLAFKDWSGLLKYVIFNMDDFKKRKLEKESKIFLHSRHNCFVMLSVGMLNEETAYLVYS